MLSSVFDFISYSEDRICNVPTNQNNLRKNSIENLRALSMESHILHGKTDTLVILRTLYPLDMTLFKVLFSQKKHIHIFENGCVGGFCWECPHLMASLTVKHVLKVFMDLNICRSWGVGGEGSSTYSLTLWGIWHLLIGIRFLHF
jgi:hypothetical protein